MEKVSRNDEREPLGLVWVYCSFPVLALGLEKALKADAHVYREREAPASGSPSLVVFCPSGGEDDDVATGVRRIKELVPTAPVVVLGMRAELSLARAALRAKTRGFIHAGMRLEQIARALSLAKRGEMVFPREMLVDLAVGEDRQEELTKLTPRQEEILEMVAEGLSNAEIARRLWLSESTVRQHLHKVYQTLEVKNRNQAAGLFGRGKPVGSDGHRLGDAQPTQAAEASPRRRPLVDFEEET
jgi:DNA-binding NarL/FixJ family response regulator